MMGALAGLGRARARARARELLAEFDLVDAGRRRVATYSGGMRRRLDLAASLVARPSVIFLDEPTTGLDPRSRLAMWEVDLRARGLRGGVFLTTQYLEEADRLADRVAVIDGGRVVAEGTPAELKQRSADQRLDLVLADADAFATVARELADRVIASDGDGLAPRRGDRRQRGTRARAARRGRPRPPRGRAVRRPQRDARRRLPRPDRPQRRPTPNWRPPMSDALALT